MKQVGIWVVIMLVLVGTVPATAASQSNTEQEFAVVYAAGASVDAAHAAIAAAGGVIVKENKAVGMATVRTSNPHFAAAVQQQPSLLGAARNRPVGRVPDLQHPWRDEVEQLTAEERASVERQDHESQPSGLQALAAEPLAGLQWDMAMIHATAAGSYARQPGDRRVMVGIIDSGIDGSHPDLAPNFNRALSRNFATDISSIDGPCEVPSCVDPVDVDDNGHGSHVAGTVAAALNGLGIAGVAPNVTLVNVRGGQDSGFVFLQPVVDALVYSGDIGIDVVNMSFYIDPWLYNCANNPADSPEAQQEQIVIQTATQRALDYARNHGVTLVVSAGNAHTDLGNPAFDASSPDFPPGSAYPRNVDNTCLSMPVEGEGAIVVSALGPSTTKADYSNYGVEQTTVSAPGGYFRDFFGTPQYRTVTNEVLSTYPQALAVARGQLNPDGSPNTPFVVRDCQNEVCAYYQYLQGTSMAAPHAVGVAALIVSKRGKTDAQRGGLTLDPTAVESQLTNSATPHACPEPRLLDYSNVGRPAEFNAFCEGGKGFNGFYGHGIVDALRAVQK
jgi:lantibiotic leader peptide-processing serine protease